MPFRNEGHFFWDSNDHSSAIVFWSRKIRHFQEVSSRYPLQSCKPNPSLQGFSLLSGLTGEILFFFYYFQKIANSNDNSVTFKNIL
jgi:hypothetical protein